MIAAGVESIQYRRMVYSYCCTTVQQPFRPTVVLVHEATPFVHTARRTPIAFAGRTGAPSIWYVKSVH